MGKEVSFLPLKLNMRLYPHQVEAIQYIKIHNYSIIAMDMGLGKSYVAQRVQDDLKLNMLVICPSYLKFNWRSEYKKFFPKKVVEVFSTRKSICEPLDSDVCILPYSLLQYGEVLFDWADIVVFDEAHFLASMESIRTQMAHKLVFEYCPKKLLLLTGTPIQNRVMEYYSLVALCGYDPKNTSGIDISNLFPTIYDFADRFSYRQSYTIKHPTNPFKNQTIVKWSGVKDDAYLKQILKGKYFRRKMEDCLTLPPFIFKNVLIEEKNFPGLLDEFHTFSGDDRNESVKSPMKKQVALLKAKLTAEYVKNLYEEGIEKVIIYSDHVDSCKKIAEILQIPYVSGEVSMSTRNKYVEQFQNGDLKGISATISSFSTGINLTAANNLVFNDLSWIPGANSQAISRIRRIGQTKQCVIHRILGSYQDEKILEALDDKIDTIQRTT
jgi:SWI/SNF-related matrix-associated actin-dependent regulator 1 of chromatin subfamily A